jgi:hypothetical protein
VAADDQPATISPLSVPVGVAIADEHGRMTPIAFDHRFIATEKLLRSPEAPPPS